MEDRSDNRERIRVTPALFDQIIARKEAEEKVAWTPYTGTNTKAENRW